MALHWQRGFQLAAESAAPAVVDIAHMGHLPEQRTGTAHAARACALVLARRKRPGGRTLVLTYFQPPMHMEECR